jgi:peptide/nickel transport system permease protein
MIGPEGALASAYRRGPGVLLWQALSLAVQPLNTVRRDRTLLFSSLALGLLVGLAIFGRAFWPHDPLAINLGNSLQGPSGAHPMGTDSLGRDIFARFCEGARISLAVGSLVAVVGAIVGGGIGLIAGSSGALLDNVLMRLMDAILAFPPLLLAMAVTLGMGPGLRTAAIGITLPVIPWYARLVRSDVLRIRSLPFVEATVTLGASRARTMIRHILPHTAATVAIQAGSVFGYAILSLAALGFVGLGAQIPTPEWGSMITDGLSSSLTGQWWVTVFPGLGLLLAATAANIFVDRARDLLDPRHRFKSEVER